MSSWFAKAAEADHVVGKTPTGMNVFADRGADHPAYSGFSRMDHLGAANIHAARAKDLSAKANRMGSVTIKRQAAQATHFANTHRNAGQGGERLAASETGMQSSHLYREIFSKGAGAGSRGGKILGYTRSNKAIYASSSAEHYGSRKKFLSAHSHFSKQDHQDAFALHAKNTKHRDMDKQPKEFHSSLNAEVYHGSHLIHHFKDSD